MKDPKKKKKRLLILKSLLAVIGFGIAAFFLIQYAPSVKHFLTSRETIIKMEQWIASIGVLGIPVLFLLQMLQVFIAIIPSEPIEITAGICYGGLWGFLICIAGVSSGSLLVFLLIKRFGTPLVNKLVGKDKLKEFSFLNKTKQMEGITFLLYFIPGLPKDVFTYFAALTSIKTVHFILISTIARIPSVLVSTIAGDQYMQGNYKTTLWIFAIFAAIGILGMIGYRMISTKLNQKKKTEESRKGQGKE